MNTYIRSGSEQKRIEDAALAAILIMAEHDKVLSPKTMKLIAHSYNITVAQLEKAIKSEMAA